MRNSFLRFTFYVSRIMKRRLNLDNYLMNNPIREMIQRKFVANYMLKASKPMDDYLCLEIGCGRGVGAKVIIGMFGARRVIAFDVDFSQIRRAMKYVARRNLLWKVSLFVGDAERLSFTDNTFDAVFDFGVLHHVLDWRAALKEVKRVLKSEGYFLFEEPTKPILSLPLIKRLLDHPDEGLFTADEFKMALREAGFTLRSFKQADGIFIQGVGFSTCVTSLTG
ncbi:TPA: class I SAM-dependent methyltransferase [Candidatus Poribacteria bacterium]|nr:class I SAM-dependent methyltransferase [Candidatus Poribacteria bacterium]